MKQTRLIELMVMVVAMLILSGCVWGGYGGYHEDEHHDRDRGEHRDGDHGDQNH
ncbi:hypothetical protein S2091_2410 [Solimicrobium silvestre]|uniref:Lipoprotein n=1 Tax=Solimicrobium silvestre TaxID=2099400 RepID=A0A2S9GZ64_9BURK|nr:hypothetical protein S2091_2410 [Solimicrobium silvestre]